MLHANPRWLVMSEYLSYLTSRALSQSTLTGEQYWRILTEQSPVLKALHVEGMRQPEILYEPGRHGPRQLHEAPAIMLATLPFLSDEPANLLAEIEQALRSRPMGKIADHMLAVFGAVGDCLGRHVVIERTGDSLLLTGRLIELFPAARFIHLHRDGRDVAVSMSRKPDFRAKVSYFATLRKLGLDPYKPKNAYGVARWHEWIERIGSKFLSVRHFTDADVDPVDCGRHWTWMVEAGHKELSGLPPSRVLDLPYRDLVEKPQDTLGRVQSFIDPASTDRTWIDQAAVLPQGCKSYWHDGAAADVRALDTVCRKGLDILGYE